MLADWCKEAEYHFKESERVKEKFISQLHKKDDFKQMLAVWFPEKRGEGEAKEHPRSEKSGDIVNDAADEVQRNTEEPHSESRGIDDKSEQSETSSDTDDSDNNFEDASEEFPVIK